MTPNEKLCFLSLRLPSSPSNIKEVTVGKEGRVKFKILFSDFFKGESEFKKVFLSLNTESLETMYVDIAGSLLVRKNLSTFTKLLETIDFQDYNEKILSYNHLHFSLETNENSLEWTFHISFLHDLILGTFLFSPGEQNV